MHPIHVRPARPDDAADWLRMRVALWPEGTSSEHASEIDQFFAGTLKNPLEVLLAVDEAGKTVGFAELSIRNYAEDCETDRVAYLEGWYVEAAWRRRGVGKALVDRRGSLGARAGLHGVRLGRATRQHDKRGRSPGAGVRGDGADSVLQEEPVTPALH